MADEKQPDSASLLSTEPTLELILRARAGDQSALEAILERCLPPLTRWAHGRLPPAARGHLDTGDLVQDAAMNAIARLDSFQPRQVGALQAYLRQSVINRIRDEMRRFGRRPVTVEYPENLPAEEPSPLELAIERETYDAYREALSRLRLKEQELVIARIEAQWTPAEIAEHFGFKTVDSARMAVNRAVQRLGAVIKGDV
jgi:RNA polymerase sigma-70 factor, ECF subfamily